MKYFLISFLIVGHGFLFPKTGDVSLKVEGLRNNKGFVRAAIFNSEKDFPQNGTKAVKRFFAPIKNKAATILFKDLHYSDYAIICFHDENKNRKLDKNWFGVPSEGLGASNNAKGSMGPPKYKDAKFTLNNKNLNVKIRISY